MLGLLAPTLVTLVAALWLGGSLRGFLHAGIRGWPAMLATFAVELVLYNPPVDRQAWAMQIGPWIWLATKLVLLAVLIWNAAPSAGRVSWPWRVAALGIGLNSLAIGLNDGHMPQSTDAALALWGSSHIDPSRLQNVAPMGPQTLLPWLGDVFAEPGWLPRANVVSIGDILLSVGVASWVLVAVHPVERSGTWAGTFTRLRRRTLVSLLGAPTNGAARPSRRSTT
jgi:hypothetical protein